MIFWPPPQNAPGRIGDLETNLEFMGAFAFAFWGAWARRLRNGFGAGLRTPFRQVPGLTRWPRWRSDLVAQELPGPAGVQLLPDARAALVTALQVNAMIAAATMVAASVLAARMLRTDPARGPEASFRPS